MIVSLYNPVVTQDTNCLGGSTRSAPKAISVVKLMLSKDQIWKVRHKVSKLPSLYPTAGTSGMSEGPKLIFANTSYSEANQLSCTDVLEQLPVITGVAVVLCVVLGSDR